MDRSLILRANCLGVGGVSSSSSQSSVRIGRRYSTAHFTTRPVQDFGASHSTRAIDSAFSGDPSESTHARSSTTAQFHLIGAANQFIRRSKVRRPNCRSSQNTGLRKSSAACKSSGSSSRPRYSTISACGPPNVDCSTIRARTRMTSRVRIVPQSTSHASGVVVNRASSWDFARTPEHFQGSIVSDNVLRPSRSCHPPRHVTTPATSDVTRPVNCDLHARRDRVLSSNSGGVGSMAHRRRREAACRGGG